MSTHLIDVDVASFEQQVLQASFQRPVLVDFWADWCAPCIVIAPLLEQLADEFNECILLAKLEVDEGDNMRLAGQYQVRGFPTVMLFIDGEERARFSGARPLGWIESWLEQEAGAALDGC